MLARGYIYMPWNASCVCLTRGPLDRRRSGPSVAADSKLAAAAAADSRGGGERS